jgi:cytidine deaminase
MKKLDLKIFIEEYLLDEITQTERNLLNQAQKASRTAYAPYSHFHVGAAILLEDGTVVFGSNQENAAYPSGLCAERTAVFAAGANYPNQKIICIAIAAYKADDSVFLPISPCGACRQAVLEYENKQNQSIRMLMQGNNSCVYIVPSITSLLPLQFSKHNLK